MSKSAAPSILSMITGSVLLIHVLGLLALMVQRSPFLELSPASPMVVSISEASGPELPTSLAVADLMEVLPAPEERLLPAQQLAPSDQQAVAQTVPTSSRSDPPAATQSVQITRLKATEPKPLVSRPKIENPPQKQPAQPLTKTPSHLSKPHQHPSTSLSTRKKVPPSSTEKLRTSEQARAALQRLRRGAEIEVAPPSSRAAHSQGAAVGKSHPSPSKASPSHERALEGLMAALQNCVVIPEQGEVKLRLRINAQGCVTHIDCLKAGSNRNREVIEKALRLIRLPVEGLVHDGSLTVVVTFRHA